MWAKCTYRSVGCRRLSSWREETASLACGTPQCTVTVRVTGLAHAQHVHAKFSESTEHEADQLS
jgi:hypothetical protein